MRVRAGELVGDHIEAEKAPFSFKVDSGGEEIRLAPFVYVKNLKDKVESILEQKERYTIHESITALHHSLTETGMAVFTGTKVASLTMRSG